MDSDVRHPTPRILVVDDESFIREAIEMFLMAEGLHVVAVESGERALNVLEREVIDVAILDISMPGMDGITLLGEIKKLRPDVEVIMASGCGTLESAVSAMRMGAYDYITKPILNFEDDLLKVVEKALERRRLLAANRRLAADVQEINRELKTSNGDLKRHLATFEILSDTSRLVGEMDSADAVLDLTMDTLEYQLDVKHCCLFVESDHHWTVRRSLGMGPSDRTVSSELLDKSQVDPRPLSACDLAGLAKLLEGLGVTEHLPTAGVIIPLRARCEVRAFLLVLEPPMAEPESTNRTRLLTLLAAQIAAPLALYRERVVS